MARMNIAVKQMSRKRRQIEGMRPPEPYYPPAPQPAQLVDAEYYDAYPSSYEGIQDVPLTFAYVKKDEQQQRTNFFVAPAFDENELVELPTSHQDLARSLDLSHFPDSDLFAEGDKIRPWAHIRVPSYLAISEWLGGADDEFRSPPGKAQFDWVISQYVGQQHPIDVTPLIPETEYTTYGALNALSPGQIEQFPASDGYLFD
jgi:hypothetical protein